MRKRSGRSPPWASAVPLLFSIASSSGSPTVTVEAPANPRSIVRRLSVKLRMVGFLLGLVDQPEQRARGELGHEVLHAVVALGERVVERDDRVDFAGGLLVADGTADEVVDQAQRRARIGGDQVGELRCVRPFAEAVDR